MLNVERDRAYGEIGLEAWMIADYVRTGETWYGRRRFEFLNWLEVVHSLGLAFARVPAIHSDFIKWQAQLLQEKYRRIYSLNKNNHAMEN